MSLPKECMMVVLETFRTGSKWVFRLLRDHESLSTFGIDESGQDMMEYALAAALLSLCAIASLQTLSAKVVQLWTLVYTRFNGAIN